MGEQPSDEYKSPPTEEKPAQEKPDSSLVMEKGKENPKNLNKAHSSFAKKVKFSLSHMRAKQNDVSAEFKLIAEEDVLKWSLYALKFGAFSDAVCVSGFFLLVYFCVCISSCRIIISYVVHIL